MGARSSSVQLPALRTPSPEAFAATISLRLTATLNLRRTLGLVLALAVPQLADWASLQLDDGNNPRGGSLLAGAAPALWSASPGGGPSWTEAIDRLSADGTPPHLEVFPLRARGRLLGELTVARRAARGAFDEPLRVLVAELAARAALALDTARVYEERTTLATTLRDSLRPEALPAVPSARLGARYRPAEEATEIGGDFYDVYRGPDGSWWFAVGDVCGKGVEAAVLTGKVRSALHMAALTGREPDLVLGLLNEVMLLEGGSSFVTLVVGRIAPGGPGELELRVAGGGHLPPLVLRADGTVETVVLGGVLVGMLPEATFRPTTLSLGPGEVCLLYTDGVVEAGHSDGEMFGAERLERLVADCSGMPPQAVAERVEQNVLEHLAGRAHDDIALFAVAPDVPAPATEGAS